MSRPPPPPAALPGERLDRWLWAARFYKTRALAAEAVDRQQVRVNGQPAKVSRQLHLGDVLELNPGGMPRTVIVRGLSAVRGPAPVAQQLYEETPESVVRRAALAEQRRMGIEPASSLAQGRPTKRDRRQLVEWQRWSVSLD